MNFFDVGCQEPVIAERSFGLCDGGDHRHAYSDINDPDLWVATVINDQQLQITFTAIDKCVIQGDEEQGRGRCDCMLTSALHIFFVELKVQRENWVTHAIDQLESTVQFFLANHDLTKFKHKKAFACNRKHPHFYCIDHERKMRFWNSYKVKLDVQSRILVV